MSEMWNEAHAIHRYQLSNLQNLVPAHYKQKKIGKMQQKGWMNFSH